MVSHPLEASSVIDGIDSLIDHFEIGHSVCLFHAHCRFSVREIKLSKRGKYLAGLASVTASWNALTIVRLMHCKVNVTKQKINFSYATHSRTATQ